MKTIVDDGIPYHSDLIISLEKSLQSAFNWPYLRLTRRPRATVTNFSVVQIEDAGKIVQGQHGVAILDADGKATSFYFGFVANFGEIESQQNKKGQVRPWKIGPVLLNASLSVFHDIYAGELLPLFRAEWDWHAASDEGSKHAQPHWHFVQRPEEIERIIQVLQGQPHEFSHEQSQLFDAVIDCGRI